MVERSAAPGSGQIETEGSIGLDGIAIELNSYRGSDDVEAPKPQEWER